MIQLVNHEANFHDYIDDELTRRRSVLAKHRRILTALKVTIIGLRISTIVLFGYVIRVVYLAVTGNCVDAP